MAERQCQVKSGRLQGRKYRGGVRECDTHPTDKTAQFTVAIESFCRAITVTNLYIIYLTSSKKETV